MIQSFVVFELMEQVKALHIHARFVEPTQIHSLLATQMAYARTIHQVIWFQLKRLLCLPHQDPSAVDQILTATQHNFVILIFGFALINATF